MPELITYGIVLGSIIALGAIGLTLVYGIIRFANFAHGDLMSAGAYVALFHPRYQLRAFFFWVAYADRFPYLHGGSGMRGDYL